MEKIVLSISYISSRLNLNLFKNITCHHCKTITRMHWTELCTNSLWLEVNFADGQVWTSCGHKVMWFLEVPALLPREYKLARFYGIRVQSANKQRQPRRRKILWDSPDTDTTAQVHSWLACETRHFHTKQLCPLNSLRTPGINKP